MKEVWKQGKNGGCVVSDIRQNRPRYNEKDHESEMHWFGGYIVAESIVDDEKCNLIAAAPEMLDLLIKVEEHLSSTNSMLRSHRLNTLNSMIISEHESKYTGRPRFETQEEYNAVAERHSRENREEGELLISVRNAIKKATGNV